MVKHGMTLTIVSNTWKLKLNNIDKIMTGLKVKCINPKAIWLAEGSTYQCIEKANDEYLVAVEARKILNHYFDKESLLEDFEIIEDDFEVDMSLFEPPHNYKQKISGFVARDGSGLLTLHENYPELKHALSRLNNASCHYWSSNGRQFGIPESMNTFPSLKYTDKPIKCEMEINIKEIEE